MIRQIRLLGIVVCAAEIGLAAPVAAQQSYPVSREQSVVDQYHGVEIADPFRWLEDRTAPETRAWIDTQNAFREALMEDVSGGEAIEARLRELMMVDVVGAPIVRGGKYFFSRRAADQDLFVIHMQDGPDGDAVPLIDPHIMATEVPMSVGLQAVSRDGSILAYGIRQGGQDEVVVRFLDVDTRRVLRDVLPRGRYFGVQITPDNAGYYFVRFTEEGPRLIHRVFGLDEEHLIYGEGLGPEKIVFGQLSSDGRYLLVTQSEGTSGGNDLLLIDTEARTGPVPMVVGTGQNFSATFAGERIVIRTDWGAPNGRVMVADPASPSSDDWEEIIPEGDHVMQGVSPAGGHLWVRYLENVASRVRGYDLSGRHVRDIAMPGIGTTTGLAGAWEQDEAFFGFTSYNRPSTTYRYSVARDEREVWFAQDVAFASDDFVVEQVWYTSADGTSVPMFLTHRRGLERDGANPVFLTAYGGFNISLTPSFNPQHALFLERGGVLAVPNLRGGGEFGEAWHKAGMFENKQNVFDDFIAAAEWLIAEGYTNPERLAISGGSNGGLLVGAAMTQRPDLYQVVVCAVPLLDMLRFQHFLAGPFWVSEYGSADDEEQFGYLRAYSPYHNVQDGAAYPAVFFETGDGDTRVAPLHARKMTALMQGATASDRPIVLKYDTEAGHSGGLPARKVAEDTATRLTFVMWQLGMLGGGVS